MEYKFFDKCKVNLKTLSKVTQGQKLTISHGYISIDTSSMSSLRRRFTGQSREFTIDEVTDCINGAMELGQILYDFIILSKNISPDSLNDSQRMTVAQKSEMYNTLYACLTGAREGINALMSTYNDDKSIITRYASIEKDLTTFLSNNKLM